MKKYFFVYFFVCQIFFGASSFAGTDPIAWSISPAGGFPAQTRMGSTYVVSYTLSNNLPFAVPLSVYGQYNGGSFGITNGCNTTLAPKNQTGSSCLVHLFFQPTKAGTHTAKIIMAYHRNRVPLPTLSSTSTSIETNHNITGQVTVPLPAVTYIGESYPVNFTFINNGNVTITATQVNVQGFVATGNTCSSALASNSTCSVTGTFTPSATGLTTLAVTYVYNGGSVPLSTQTNSKTSVGPCHQVTGYAALPLPGSTLIHSDHVAKFEFTNHCSTTSETLGAVSLSADVTSSPSTITKGNDNCSGRTLTPGATCDVFASVIANGVTTGNDLSVTASIPYNGNTLQATTTTSESVNAIANSSTLHTVMFVNQCDQNVWYEFQNGAGGTGPTRKSPDPSGIQPFSFYQLNQQVRGLAPFTKTIKVDEYVNGALYGRTGCNTTTGICQTANCQVIANSGTCVVGNDPTPPQTIFEMNLAESPASDGVYDVSIINGFNLPGEIRSLAPTVNPLNFNNACGQSTGAIIQPVGSTLGACSWTFNPPSTISPDTPANYIWVSAGAQDGCTTSCATAGEVCGTAFATAPSNAPINRRCGTFLGYWTIADFVGYTSAGQWGTVNLYSDYNLGASMTTISSQNYGAGAIVSNLYSCTETANHSLLSGYSSTFNACGCYNWNQTGSVAKTAQSFNCLAGGINPDWINNVFGRITWLKQACPTAYSYQYDDASTSFTCNVTGKKTSYEVVFCPGGKTGRPGS